MQVSQAKSVLWHERACVKVESNYGINQTVPLELYQNTGRNIPEQNFPISDKIRTETVQIDQVF